MLESTELELGGYGARDGILRILCPVAFVVLGELLYLLAVVSGYEYQVQRREELKLELKRRKEKEEREARERHIREERARVDRLLAEAASYRQAHDIRGYVENVRIENAGNARPVDPHLLERWASWALAPADRIEPLHSGACGRSIVLPSGAESTGEAARPRDKGTSESWGIFGGRQSRWWRLYRLLSNNCADLSVETQPPNSQDRPGPMKSDQPA